MTMVTEHRMLHERKLKPRPTTLKKEGNHYLVAGAPLHLPRLRREVLLHLANEKAATENRQRVGGRGGVTKKKCGKNVQ